MNFLAIVLALAIERAFPHGTALGESRLLALALRRLKWLDFAGLAWLFTLLLAAAVFGLDWFITAPLPRIAFGGLVLLLCLGPRDLADDVQRLIAAKSRGDAAEAERLSRALQSGPAPDESHRSLIGALFIQSHERLFGVLLWFMLLGPAAAVAYRLASRLPPLLESLGFAATTRQAADQLHGIAAWLPSRITAALFALAGSMDDAVDAWKRVGELHYQEAWRSHSWAVLAEVGTGALAMEEADGTQTVAPNLAAALREVLRIQTRALLLLLAAFAIYTSGTLV